MKTVAVIQARMGSSRLPGKVMRNLGGRSVLAQVVERVASAGAVSEIVVATTDKPADDVIVAEAAKIGVSSFRGSEDDVLSRYWGAAREAGADVVVRVTSDCPLYDGAILQSMLNRFHEGSGQIDYLSNSLRRTFPRGLDTEIFTFAVLERAFHEARELAEREHVTPFLYRHPELFRLDSFEDSVDRSNLRWTLDTEDDWRFVSAIYERLGSNFSTQDVLSLLESAPDLLLLNSHIEQKAF